MSMQLKILSVCAMSVVLVSNSFGYEIKYEELKGARRKTDMYWEIGFAGHLLWNKISPIRDEVEGIAWVKGGKWNNEKIHLPDLNITGDTWLIGAPEFLKNKSGEATKLPDGGMFNGSRLQAYENGFLSLKDLSAKDGTVIIPATFIDLPAGTVKDDICLTLTYEGENKKQTVDFALLKDYANSDGSARIGFFNGQVTFSWYITKSCYVIQANKARGRIIGKIPMGEVPYAGQLETSKTQEKLQVVPGSISVVEKSIPQFQKSDKLIWPGHVYGADDFTAYELSTLGNLVPLHPSLKWIPVALWDKYPEEVKEMKKAASAAQQAIDDFHKYGVNVELEASPKGHAFPHPKMMKECYPQFIAVKLTREGKFEEAQKGWGSTIDEANPEAVKFLEEEFSMILKKLFRDVDYLMCEPEYRLFTPYNYLGCPFYSKAALENYRKYLGKADAKFPTASSVPDTDRTFNTPTAKDWESYFAWRTKVHTDFMISWAKTAMNAFKDDQRYKGAMVEDSPHVAVTNDPHGIDLERLFACPDISLFVSEYTTSKNDPYYKIWRQYAQKYKKKYITLFDYNMIYPPVVREIYSQLRGGERKEVPEFAEELRKNMDLQETILVNLFVSAGVDVDTEGYACCGMSVANNVTYTGIMKDCGGIVNNRIWTVWQALIRKYYGYGCMSLEKAESILEEIKKNKIINIIDSQKRKTVVSSAKKAIIDGKNDDWDFSKAEKITDKEQALIFKDWKVPDDCSCVFVAALDDKNLYFAALVTDDKVVLKKDLLPCPKNQWADEVNLYISTEDIRYTAGIWRGKNAMQLRFIPGETKVWDSQAAPISGSDVAWEKTDKGYFIEGRVPLEYLHFKPIDDMQIGLEVGIIDADSDEGSRGTILWNSKTKPYPEHWGIGIIKASVGALDRTSQQKN